MRYATFSLKSDPTERLGAVLSGKTDLIYDIHVLLGAATGSLPRTLVELIREGPEAWTRLAARITDAAAGDVPAPAKYAGDVVRWHAPIARPSKNIICLGLNYSDHVKESAQARGREVKIPEHPVFFTKAPTTVNGPFDPIPFDPQITQQVDYEVELGVVIGVGGRNIARANALSHVFGYTVINDVSARDLQMRHLQWFKGKSLDGFCPMGPVVVSADEFGNPQTKKIGTRVNGVQKQNSTTASMIFPVDVIIEVLSKGMTLEPGDVIATGTPEGVGLGRTPQEWLNDGDMVETDIEGIGTLRNQVVRV
ncbi:MAG TPA: fumarylacetoacetate hydrolase family protein [Vicinamibacterales bacterium]|nr:fumarylacetoacetate hydrolase family protein [Vicinamibacterales bacterium]